MAKLYVVNCTGQHRAVNYRLDYTIDDQGRRTSERLMPYKTINIEPRRQIQFGGEYHPSQISELVEQLEATCGAVNVDNVRTAKKMGVVKMIWSVDKTVPLPILKDVVEHNRERLSQLGAERRERLALMADAGLTQLAGSTLPKLEVEFEQVEEDENFQGRLTEGLRLNYGNSPRGRGGRGRKAA